MSVPGPSPCSVLSAGRAHSCDLRRPLGGEGGMSSLGGGCRGWAWATVSPGWSRSPLPPLCPPCPSLSSQHPASLPALPPAMLPLSPLCLSRCWDLHELVLLAAPCVSFPHTSPFSSSLDASWGSDSPTHGCCHGPESVPTPCARGWPTCDCTCPSQGLGQPRSWPTGYKLGVPTTPHLGLKIRRSGL